MTIQAQILDLLREMQRESGAALLFITHDMAVVAEIADRGRLIKSFPSLSLKEQWSYFCLAAWERVFRVSW